MKNNDIRPKMQFIEGVLNEIINTIGSRPSESGGLLFGKEDDYIITKFVFDRNAKVTASTYTFNTDYLNPEIKRLWDDEGLSCIGFIHSHPKGYSNLSIPDIEYFNRMFKTMPRKRYLTPIVFTVPDGGFKIHAHILPANSRETVRADIEILPDDYYKNNNLQHPTNTVNQDVIVMSACRKSKLRIFENTFWILWKICIALSLSWFIVKGLYLLTNHLHFIYYNEN